MKTYTTTIKAICPNSGKVETYSGPRIKAKSFEDALVYCKENGLGYCKVDGEFVSEEPFKARRL